MRRPIRAALTTAAALVALLCIASGRPVRAVTPLTDGLLVLRYLFGFTGAALTSGAVDTANCTRCDAAAIGTYLSILD
jgi:hypothetical protein